MTFHIDILADINDRAQQVLLKELGVADTLRFLQQYRAGHGDYTVERTKLFEGESVTGLVAEIKARRKDAGH